MNKVGRPTKYVYTMLDDIEEYIKYCGREQTELPTLEGCAEYLKIDTDTIVEWCKENKEFSVAIKRLKEKQKNQLMNDGMYGGKEINTAMAIFLLKVNHNMVETSHTDITSDGEKLEGVVIYKPEKNTE